MNVALSVVLVIEIGAAFTVTGAFPSWSLSDKSKHNSWSHRHSDAYNSCTTGHCVKVWNCPKAAIVAESEKDSCLHWYNGPWVCCLDYDDSIHHWQDTDFYSSESPSTLKYTTLKPLKRISISVEEHKYDVTNKPLLKNRQSHISPLGDILKNNREKYPLYRPENKTTGTKFPHVTNVITDSKLTSNYDYKRTTNSRDKAHISSPNYYKRTTNSWDKPHTSTPSTNYYKRTTDSWEKPGTSTQNTNYYKRTANSWDKPYISTSNTNYYKRTTNSWEKPPSLTPSTNYKKTTNSWKNLHTSDSRIIFPNEAVTKNSSSHSPTKKISDNRSTKRSWIQTSSTKSPSRYSTAYAKTASQQSLTTKHLFSKKPTVATNASTQRKYQSWGSSTITYPARNGNTKPKTRASSTLSTTRSTKRYAATTSLPNLNIQLCGLRDERLSTNRHSRDENYRRNPTVHSGGTRSRSKVPYQRIVGGEEVEPFSWPWVAALYKVTSSGGNRLLSAGSLINENFILTAAHVFTPDDLRTSSYVVMLGTHDAQDAVAQYVVSSVLLHPKYEHRYYYNDIALLKLERKVVFNNYIMPICLPSSSAPLHADKDLLGKNVTVMGWGDESFGGKSSQVLKKASFPIVSRVSCNASYLRVASNRFPKGITADMLCAGDPKGGKDACQGDSGGPLTVIENGRHTQVGIVSFGYKCGDKEYPGVYTKVAPYLNWMAENTKYVDEPIYYEDY